MTSLHPTMSAFYRFIHSALVIMLLAIFSALCTSPMVQAARQVKSLDETHISAPASYYTRLRSGQNSFTKSQMETYLHQRGFTTIKFMRLDEQGIWRSLIQFKERPFLISVDYRGHLVVEKFHSNREEL